MEILMMKREKFLNVIVFDIPAAWRKPKMKSISMTAFSRNLLPSMCFWFGIIFRQKKGKNKHQEKWNQAAVEEKWSSGKFRNVKNKKEILTKMEKSSSLNIKSFRDLLSTQSKSYKISPNNYHHPTEVKLNGLNGTVDDSTNIDDVYSIKRNKSDSDCSRRNFCDVICGSLFKFVGNYNSSFCLTVLTPVACR